MDFSDVEDRANASVMARMVNATAVFQGGTPFPVVFDNGAASVMNGLADAAQPSIHALASDFGAHTQGDPVAVTYKGTTTNYLLRGPLPDGTGFVECSLELVTS